MNTLDYIQTVSQLGQALVTDPQTLLALTVAWLDPLAILSDYQSLIDNDISDYYYAGDTVGEGLHVTRTCFPDIYAHAIAKLRQDVPIIDVLHFIDGEIERQTGIPMSDYCAEEFFYSYGIPMPWYGLELDDPDFCERHPDAWHLMQLFGSTIDEHQTNAYATQIDISQEMWLAAHVLHASLYDYRDSPRHEALMHAIGFVFACSGNSCVDISPEMGYELQPLQWIPEDVEFAQQICQEAHEILFSAHQGLQLIDDPILKDILTKKIKMAKAHVKICQKRGQKIYDIITDDTPNPFNIQWDDFANSADDETDADVIEFPLRVGAA